MDRHVNTLLTTNNPYCSRHEFSGSRPANTIQGAGKSEHFERWGDGNVKDIYYGEDQFYIEDHYRPSYCRVSCAFNAASVASVATKKFAG